MKLSGADYGTRECERYATHFSFLQYTSISINVIFTLFILSQLLFLFYVSVSFSLFLQILFFFFSFLFSQNFST